MPRRSILADPLELEWLRARVTRGLFGGDEVLRVGRFEVRGKLGAGAMGAVWAAHDPELSRDVAIKMLLGDGDDARLRREAQAMARLRHANVVTVHEIGTWRNTLFVAMERVEGPTLRAWLAERRRHADEIVGIFSGAGRGLAAAHAAGLVHRDFKPDNVLVDSSGHARVADFGLALAEADAERHARAGTPAYMAPEQLGGAPATAQADQYSFAVALRDALHEQRPAPRVRRAVERALSSDPAARFPSMDALLRELSPPSRYTGWWVAGVVAVLGVAGILWVTARSDERARVDPCGGGDSALAGAWDAARAREVHAGIVATGRPYAETAAAHTIELLDDYARRWRTAHRQACEATRVHRNQPEDLFALRTACLSDRRRVLGALAARLAHADSELAERAARAAGELPSLESCADLAALRRRTPPPADAKTKAALAELDDPLADARAAYLAGRYDDALATARTLAARAEPLGYAPRTAEILLLVGQSASSGGQPKEADTALERAYAEALAASDDAGAAATAITLAYNLGFIEEKVDDGRRWTRIAAGHLRAMGDEPAFAARLANVEGDIAQTAGDHDEALAAFVRAQASWRAAAGDHSIDVAGAIHNEGQALHKLGRNIDALTRLNEAERLWREELGTDHPLVGMTHQTLTNVLRNLERFDEAIDHATRALAIARANLGPAHPDVGLALGALGNVYLDAGRPAEALRQFEEAEPIFAARLGADHPLVASTVSNRGMAELDLGRLDEAAEHLRAGLERKIARRGANHPSLMNSYEALGDLALMRARPREALAQHERAREIGLAAYGEDTDQVAFALVGIGRAELALGDARHARRSLDRAVELRSRPDAATAAELAVARFHAGRARWELGDHDGGRALVDQAATVLAGANPAYDETRRELATWQAAHAPPP